MSEAMITRRSNLFALDNEGKKLPPWLFEKNDSFTVPITGKYRIICVGGGGNGIRGYLTNNGTYYCASGGAGGIGILITDLVQGNTYPITVGHIALSSFGNLITAKPGGSGYMNSTTGSKIDGTGGTASGTNVISYKGGDGYTGYGMSTGSKGGSVGLYLPGYMSYPVSYAHITRANTCGVSGVGIFGNLSSTDIKIEPTGTNNSILECGVFVLMQKYSHMAYSDNDVKTLGSSCIVGSGGLYGGGGGSYYSNNSTTAISTSGAPGCVIIQFLGDVA